MKVNLQWQENCFAATGEGGASIRLGAGNDNLPTPMETLLMAVGGCSGIDVVSTLAKMRQPLTSLAIAISGRRREEHPRYFETILLTYRIRGDVEESKARRAIELSLEKYCSVSNALKPQAQVTYQLELLPGA